MLIAFIIGSIVLTSSMSMSLVAIIDQSQYIETGYIALMQIIQGGDTETLLPLCEDFYHELAKDVKKQWKRLGGKWAVCQAVFTRKLRDQIREDMNIGEDLGM